MKRLLVLLSIMILMAGCGSAGTRKYSPGVRDINASYRLIVLSYSEGKEALGAAILDLEGDDVSYTPHPDEKHVQTFEGMRFTDASQKARDILNRHCGVFTFSTLLLADHDNIPTGYEILPVIKETAYCIIGTPVSINYQSQNSGNIVVSLPEREALPFSPGGIKTIN